jgi:hypothetical protein
MEEVVAPGSCQMFKDFVQKADVNGDGKADKQEMLDAMAKEGEEGGKEEEEGKGGGGEDIYSFIHEHFLENGGFEG